MASIFKDARTTTGRQWELYGAVWDSRILVTLVPFGAHDQNEKVSRHNPKRHLAYGCTCSPHGTLHTEFISDGSVCEFTDTPVACSLARAVVNVYTLRKRALRYRA